MRHLSNPGIKLGLLFVLAIFAFCLLNFAIAGFRGGWTYAELSQAIVKDLPPGTDVSEAMTWFERHSINTIRFEGPLGGKPKSPIFVLPGGYHGDISNVAYAIYGHINPDGVSVPWPILESASLQIWIAFDKNDKLINFELYKESRGFLVRR